MAHVLVRRVFATEASPLLTVGSTVFDTVCGPVPDLKDVARRDFTEVLVGIQAFDLCEVVQADGHDDATSNEAAETREEEAAAAVLAHVNVNEASSSYDSATSIQCTKEAL